MALTGTVGPGGILQNGPDAGKHYLDVISAQLAPSSNAAFANQMAIMGQTPNATQVQNHPTSAWSAPAPAPVAAPAPAPVAAPTPQAYSPSQPPAWYTQPPAWMQQPQQQSPTQNPYLPQVSDALQQRSQFALDQAMNRINSNAVGIGGLGGSRQGVAQGIAAGLANQGLVGELANLNLNAWNQDANRALTSRGQDMSFWSSERAGDRADMQLGASLWNMGLNAPWQPIQQATGTFAPFTGNGTTTTNVNAGGGWMGALGGALGGANFAHQAGWWK